MSIKQLLLITLQLTLPWAMANDQSWKIQPFLDRFGYSNWSEASRHVLDTQPSFKEFIHQTWICMTEFGGLWNCTETTSSFAPLSNIFGVHNIRFLASSVLLCCVLIRLKQLLTTFLFKSGFCSFVNKPDSEKLLESIWLGSLHLFLYALTYYVVIYSGRYDFFQRPCEVWRNVAYNEMLYIESPPYDLQLIYCIQLAHYMQDLFYSQQSTTRRADWKAMLMHHLVTIILILFSYIRRFLPIGVLTFFLHDVSDVILHFTKLNVYLKFRNGQKCVVHEFLGNLGFVAFASSWFYFRLYWFPLKVLQATNWCQFVHLGCFGASTYVISNSMLGIIQLLHIYWATFILNLMFKLATGRLTDVTDVRESTVAVKVRTASTQADFGLNGSAEQSSPSSTSAKID